MGPACYLSDCGSENLRFQVGTSSHSLMCDFAIAKGYRRLCTLWINKRTVYTISLLTTLSSDKEALVNLLDAGDLVSLFSLRGVEGPTILDSSKFETPRLAFGADCCLYSFTLIPPYPFSIFASRVLSRTYVES